MTNSVQSLMDRIAQAEADGWSITLNKQGRFPLADYGWTLRKNGNGVTEIHIDSYDRLAAWKAIIHLLPS